MRRLICTFVVRIWHKQVFSWRGSYDWWSNLENENLIFFFYLKQIWAAAWRNQQNDLCAQRILRSAQSDQSSQPWVLSYPLSAQQRLWSDWADAQADLSLRWAHISCRMFCHASAHFTAPSELRVYMMSYPVKLKNRNIFIFLERNSRWQVDVCVTVTRYSIYIWASRSLRS